MSQSNSDTLPLPERHPEAAQQARAKLEALHSRPTPAPTLRPVSPLAENSQQKPQPSSPLAEANRQRPPATPRTETPRPKLARPELPSRLRPIIIAVGCFALLVLAFKLPVVLTQMSYLTKTKPEPITITQVQQVETVPPEPIVQIAKISVNAPVVYETSTAEAAIQKSLQNGIVHYATTARPGDPGNAVFVGHSSNDWWEPGNYKFVFVLLDKMVPGDTFSLNYNSRKYIYQVTEVKVVEPTDLSVLAPTPEPTATLITCTPPGTSWKRLVVRGKQISPEPNLATAQPPVTGPAVNEGFLPGNAPSFFDQLTKVWDNFRRTLGGDGADDQETPQTLPGV